jgi:hypothetical protein
MSRLTKREFPLPDDVFLPLLNLVIFLGMFVFPLSSYSLFLSLLQPWALLCAVAISRNWARARWPRNLVLDKPSKRDADFCLQVQRVLIFDK